MDVFIVYSLKDRKNLFNVKEILISLGYNPIILDEIAPTGTIFEKLTSTASKCEKAIVIYSGIDCGGLYKNNKANVSLKRRARENVVFELGLFIGLLKIQNVLILLNNNIERSSLPSDLAGIETKSLNVNKKTLKKNIKMFLERQTIWKKY